jgi:hypothetical protein
MTTRSEAKPEIFANPEALARRVADWLLAAAAAKDGIFAVALQSGLCIGLTSKIVVGRSTGVESSRTCGGSWLGK